MKIKKIFKKQVFVAGLFLAVGIMLKVFGVTDYFSLSYLYENLSAVHDYINHHYCYSVMLFIGSFFLATCLSLPGSSFFLTAAGLLFGIVPGVIYSVIGGSLGATVLFLTSRYVIGNWVQRTYSHQLLRFNNEMDHYGHYYLLVTRFLSVIPFFMVNLLSGLTLMPTKDFMWTTAVGMIPPAIVFGYAGKQLSYVDSFETIFCPPVIFAFGILIFFKVLLVPFVYKFYKRRSA